MKSLVHVSVAAVAGLAMAVAACGESKAPARQSSAQAAAPSAVVQPRPGDAGCPATGLWAQCSVIYRLVRAGIAPHVDSSAKLEDETLTGRGFVVKFGTTSHLDVYLYPDSAARIADEAKLDKTKLVSATAPQTINRERTLIENANLLALLTSINDRLRERVSDALTAGAPQPPAPVTVKP